MSTQQQVPNDTSTNSVEPTKVESPAIGAGTIHGVLVDQTGALLPNMPVSILRPGTYNAQRTVRTDAHGEFVFADLPAGRYELMFGTRDDPRQRPDTDYVQVKAGEVSETKGTIYPEPVDTGPCCKPYGAPPARRRVV
ncbi:MAG: carboxypeptidase regulatory-like domain-containing protein [Kofleriaceae bacterium]|nr:carboxypeptidase regulatory-like domain-containing protein [Kofleriaceae bacterium]